MPTTHTDNNFKNKNFVQLNFEYCYSSQSHLPISAFCSILLTNECVYELNGNDELMIKSKMNLPLYTYLFNIGIGNWDDFSLKKSWGFFSNKKKIHRTVSITMIVEKYTLKCMNFIYTCFRTSFTMLKRWIYSYARLTFARRQRKQNIVI